MRKLKAYSKESFAFYQEVVNNKRERKDDPGYKHRLKSIENDIKQAYKEYDDHFSSDNLHVLGTTQYNPPHSQDLLSLYKYSSKKLQELELIKKLTTDEFQRRNKTCQNCTIGEVGTFDHLVPKEEFTEFAVHPKNLFPCCSKCNSYKNEIWRDEGKRLFLNLYIDELPTVQYLFVRLDITPQSIGTEFYLQNTNRINPEIFQLIESHYSRLHLCKRFSENADDVIIRLSTAISETIHMLPLEDVKDVCIKASKRHMALFGSNYWKSILEMELLNSNDFMNRF
jgi:hypothetical protein